MYEDLYEIILESCSDGRSVHFVRITDGTARFNQPETNDISAVVSKQIQSILHQPHVSMKNDRIKNFVLKQEFTFPVALHNYCLFFNSESYSVQEQKYQSGC